MLYVWGNDFEIPPDKCFTYLVEKTLVLYFGRHAEDRGKIWAPHTCSSANR